MRQGHIWVFLFFSLYPGVIVNLGYVAGFVAGMSRRFVAGYVAGYVALFVCVFLRLAFEGKSDQFGVSFQDMCIPL